MRVLYGIKAVSAFISGGTHSPFILSLLLFTAGFRAITPSGEKATLLSHASPILQNGIIKGIRISAMYTEIKINNRADFFKILEDYQIQQFGYQSYIYSLLSKLIHD